MELIASELANEVDKLAQVAEASVRKVWSCTNLVGDFYYSTRLLQPVSVSAKALAKIVDELAEETLKLQKEAEKKAKAKECYDNVAALKEVYTDFSKPIPGRVVPKVDKASKGYRNAFNALERV